MAGSRKHRRQSATIVAGIIGALIITTFVISLVAPDQGLRTSVDQFPTVTPFGTSAPPTPFVLPTPDPDPALAGALPYIHRSGLFQTFLPAGSDWLVSEADLQSTDSVASVVIQSPQRLAVVHNYIQPGVEYESHETLSENFLTAQYHSEAWFSYDTWQETERRVTEDSVAIDFALENEGVDYLGRSTSRLSDDWLYVTRIVVPANNPALLEALDNYTQAYFGGLPSLQALPLGWPALVDQQAGYLLKHPPGWSVAAGGSGRPITLTTDGESGQHTIRVRAEPETSVEAVADAEAWFEAAAPEATLVAVEVGNAAGQQTFQIAYTFRDTAGDPRSGFTVLRSGEDQRLFIADARLEAADANLLADASLPEDLADLRRALTEGFVTLPATATEPIPELEVVP